MMIKTNMHIKKLLNDLQRAEKLFDKDIFFYFALRRPGGKL